MSEPQQDLPAVDGESAMAETAPTTRQAARIELGQPVVGADQPDVATDQSVVGADQPDAAAGGPEQTAPVVQDGEQNGPRWSEIQALFVDDPRGSVERALEATQGGLMTVISVLRLHEDSIPVAETGSDDAASVDTEQLRVALQSCRAFWQDLAKLGDLLRRAK